jgi:hypothetical protein
VKNIEKEEIPRLNIERNPLFLVTAVLISSILGFLGYYLLKIYNPLGFIVLVPASVLSFQSLWWLLHPFALVFDDKIEIKQSLLHHKYRYFVDVKKISESKTGKIYITYNDDEMELLNLFGIKTSHIQLLKTEMERSVSESMGRRP